MSIMIFIVKSLLILAIFHFVVPSLVNGFTGNSWAKLPAMLFCAVIAAAFMTWLHYVPFLIFFVWLILTYYTLQAMTESKFESEAGMKIHKLVFYVSSYAYVVLACLLAWLFQAEVLTGDPSDPGTPLLRYVLGMVHIPASMPFSLIFAWLIFFGFLNTHQRHARRFQGRSQQYRLALNLSVILGSLVGLGLLTYYGYQTAWYWPLGLFLLGSALAGILFGIIEPFIALLWMSLLSFIGWPFAAVWLFFIIHSLNP